MKIDPEIILSHTDFKIALDIERAVFYNRWFGLYNDSRRVFFDVKNKIVYQLRDRRKYNSKPELKLVECSNDEDFITLIKLTLLTCKQLMTETDEVLASAHIKLLLHDKENTEDKG